MSGRLFAGFTSLFAGLLLGYSALAFAARRQPSAGGLALTGGVLVALAGIWILARR